jgi:hypothetical protein
MQALQHADAQVKAALAATNRGSTDSTDMQAALDMTDTIH